MPQLTRDFPNNMRINQNSRHVLDAPHFKMPGHVQFDNRGDDYGIIHSQPETSSKAESLSQPVIFGDNVNFENSNELQHCDD